MGNEWLFQELPFFKPARNMFLVDPRYASIHSLSLLVSLTPPHAVCCLREQKGIHCRFGMRSVIAEAHFDGSRNSGEEPADGFCLFDFAC